MHAEVKIAMYNFVVFMRVVTVYQCTQQLFPSSVKCSELLINIKFLFIVQCANRDNLQVVCVAFILAIVNRVQVEAAKVDLVDVVRKYRKLVVSTFGKKQNHLTLLICNEKVICTKCQSRLIIENRAIMIYINRSFL